MILFKNYKLKNICFLHFVIHNFGHSSWLHVQFLTDFNKLRYADLQTSYLLYYIRHLYYIKTFAVKIHSYFIHWRLQPKCIKLHTYETFMSLTKSCHKYHTPYIYFIKHIHIKCNQGDMKQYVLYCCNREGNPPHWDIHVMIIIKYTHQYLFATIFKKMCFLLCDR